MAISGNERSTRGPADASRRVGHGANAEVLTKGALQAHDRYEQPLQRNGRNRANGDAADATSEYSYNYSVDLDAEGAAPAPPNFVRRDLNASYKPS